MSWSIERNHNHVAIVTMNTNKVNAQNPAFFDDLHAAFDRLETEFDDCAVVLTGTGKVFPLYRLCVLETSFASDNHGGNRFRRPA